MLRCIARLTSTPAQSRRMLSSQYLAKRAQKLPELAASLPELLQQVTLPSRIGSNAVSNTSPGYFAAAACSWRPPTARCFEALTSTFVVTTSPPSTPPRHRHLSNCRFAHFRAAHRGACGVCAGRRSVTVLLHISASSLCRACFTLMPGFYTIGPCGEEALAAVGLALRSTDAVALHYRHL